MRIPINNIYTPALKGGAPRAARALEHSGVTKIDLTNNKITKIGARTVAQLLACDILLQHLQLDDNTIGGAGARALGASLQVLAAPNALLQNMSRIGMHTLDDRSAPIKEPYNAQK